jgi:hypothetical protein
MDIEGHPDVFTVNADKLFGEILVIHQLNPATLSLTDFFRHEQLTQLNVCKVFSFIPFAGQNGATILCRGHMDAIAFG